MAKRNPGTQRKRGPAGGNLLPLRYVIVRSVFAVAFFAIDKLAWPMALIGFAWVGVFWPMRELAGGQASLLVEVLADVAINDWVYWLIIAVLGGGNVVQEGARRYYVNKNGKRASELEKLLDPTRSSSLPDQVESS